MTPQRQRFNEAHDRLWDLDERGSYKPGAVGSWIDAMDAWRAHLSHIRHHTSRRHRARRQP